MKVLRWILAVPLVILLLVLILGFTPLTILFGFFTKSDNVKTMVKASGIYDNFIEISIDALSAMSQERQAEASDDPNAVEGDDSAHLEVFVTQLKDPESDVRASIDELFPASKIEGIATQVIDQAYDFLEGRTANLNINVQLFDSDEEFTDILLTMYEVSYQAMPVCTEEITEFNPVNFYEVGCVPQGFTFSQFVELFNDQVTAYEQENGELPMSEFIEATTIKSDELSISEADAAKIQGAFSVLKQSGIALILISFVVALLAILIVPGFKAGLITTGAVVFTSGISLFVTGVTTPLRFSNSLEYATNQMTAEQAQQVSTYLPLVESVFDNFFGWFYNKLSLWGIGYMISGVVLIGIAILLTLLKGGSKEETVVKKAPETTPPVVAEKSETSEASEASEEPKIQESGESVEAPETTPKEPNVGESLLDEWNQASTKAKPDAKADSK